MIMNELPENLDENHPFIKFWIEKSGWHSTGEDWRDSEGTSEFNLAFDSFVEGYVLANTLQNVITQDIIDFN
jgi:hypothetical protein